MGSDVTPGGLGRIHCPRCHATVFFKTDGGPRQLRCPSCTSAFDFDIVYDGRKWTVRRVRWADRADSPGPT